MDRIDSQRVSLCCLLACSGKDATAQTDAIRLLIKLLVRAELFSFLFFLPSIDAACCTLESLCKVSVLVAAAGQAQTEC